MTATLRRAAHTVRANLGHWPAMVSAAVIVVVVVMSLLPFVFTGHSPTAVDPANALMGPGWTDGGTWAHPLGTDAKGRDIFARVVYGARPTVIVVTISLLIGGTVGVLLGLVAGYRSGWVSTAIMRAADVSLAFPTVLIALLAAAVAGSSVTLVVGATAFVLWARFARLVRGGVLVWREQDFVALATVAGTPRWKIMAVHLLPNLANTVIVLATLQTGWIIVLEGSLSFLGVGIPPPAPSWGNMVAEGRPLLEIAWWIALFPGLAIAVTVLAFNILGDWLRDRLDPRLQKLNP